MNKFVVIALLMINSLNCFSKTILTVKKSFGKKNVLVYSAVLKNCKLQAPYIEVKWLNIDNNKLSKLNNLESEYFTPRVFDVQANEYKFTIKASELVEMRPQEKIIRVLNEDCKPKAIGLIENTYVELREVFAQLIYNFPTSITAQYLDITGAYMDGRAYENTINF